MHTQFSKENLNEAPAIIVVVVNTESLIDMMRLNNPSKDGAPLAGIRRTFFDKNIKQKGVSTGFIDYNDKFCRDFFGDYCNPWVIHYPDNKTVAQWKLLINYLLEKISVETDSSPKHFVTQIHYDAESPMPSLQANLLATDAAYKIQAKFKEFVPQSVSPPPSSVCIPSSSSSSLNLLKRKADIESEETLKTVFPELSDEL